MPELRQADVEDILQYITGIFTYRDMQDFGIRYDENKQNLRKIMQRLCNEGSKVVRHGNRDGMFRTVDGNSEEMRFWEADVNDYVPIQLPFGISQYCLIRPHDIIIVAGEKSAGKTAFLYNIIVDNMDILDTWLWNNETGASQMKQRMFALAPNMEIPPPFHAQWKQDNFGDAIKSNPDGLHIIDYVPVDMENLHACTHEIEGVWRNLRGGVAVIAMQKKPSTKTIFKGQEKTIRSDWAYGGAPTLFRASVYISLSDSVAKIVECKNPSPEMQRRHIHPKGKSWAFDLENEGTMFTNVTDYTG